MQPVKLLIVVVQLIEIPLLDVVGTCGLIESPVDAHDQSLCVVIDAPTGGKQDKKLAHKTCSYGLSYVTTLVPENSRVASLIRGVT